MSNVLSQHKREMVVGLGRLGWSLRRIEQETGVRRETVSGYLKAAGIPVGRPKPANNPSPDSAASRKTQAPIGGDVPPNPATNPSPESAASNPANNPSPDLGAGERLGTADAAAPPPAEEGPPAPPPLPAPSLSPAQRPGPASACEPYRELIERWLALGRNGKAIWQELVDDHGFVGRYASVKRFVRQLRGGGTREAHPVICTAPGEEAQVDYGTGPLVRHPETGAYRRTRLFVMTLGFSRKSVRLLVWKSSTKTWARLHEVAFRRLGGAPRVIVLDNLREGVVTPDVYDPEINPLFRDVLRHYGVVAMPCRVNAPDRKGKVESGVGHAQSTPLKGRRFETLDDAQAFLDRWEERWADTRIHGTTKRQVANAFEEERASLLPLPLEPFRYYRYGERTVHLDGCVEVEGKYFGAPPGHIGRRLYVQWDERHVRIIEPRTGELLVEHDRVGAGRHRIRDEHRPRRTPPDVSQLLARAEIAGRNIGAVCKAIYADERELGARRILGVLSLAKKHGPAAVDEACEAALEAGVPTYRLVRRFVDRRHGPPLTLKQVDPLIRQLTHYRDLIQQRTGERNR